MPVRTPLCRGETLWRAVSLTASAAFLIILSAGVVMKLNLPAPEDRTMHDVASNHIRSLMVNHPARRSLLRSARGQAVDGRE
jgi:hypothetical protein